MWTVKTIIFIIIFIIAMIFVIMNGLKKYEMALEKKIKQKVNHWNKNKNKNDK